MRIVCQQTILMKYHALFVIFEKAQNFKCRLLQILGGALKVKIIFQYLKIVFVIANYMDPHKMCISSGSFLLAKVVYKC